ncbi:MAG: hypothetical protein FWB72_02995 [Firmicutes bacterium]|nr:hypothetical protein [Bacillota bacterium]
MEKYDGIKPATENDEARESENIIYEICLQGGNNSLLFALQDKYAALVSLDGDSEAHDTLDDIVVEKLIVAVEETTRQINGGLLAIEGGVDSQNEIALVNGKAGSKQRAMSLGDIFLMQGLLACMVFFALSFFSLIEFDIIQSGLDFFYGLFGGNAGEVEAELFRHFSEFPFFNLFTKLRK